MQHRCNIDETQMSSMQTLLILNVFNMLISFRKKRPGTSSGHVINFLKTSCPSCSSKRTERIFEKKTVNFLSLNNRVIALLLFNSMVRLNLVGKTEN